MILKDLVVERMNLCQDIAKAKPEYAQYFEGKADAYKEVLMAINRGEVNE